MPWRSGAVRRRRGARSPGPREARRGRAGRSHDCRDRSEIAGGRDRGGRSATPRPRRTRPDSCAEQSEATVMRDRPRLRMVAIAGRPGPRSAPGPTSEQSGACGLSRLRGATGSRSRQGPAAEQSEANSPRLPNQADRTNDRRGSRSRGPLGDPSSSSDRAGLVRRAKPRSRGMIRCYGLSRLRRSTTRRAARPGASAERTQPSISRNEPSLETEPLVDKGVDLPTGCEGARFPYPPRTAAQSEATILRDRRTLRIVAIARRRRASVGARPRCRTKRSMRVVAIAGRTGVTLEAGLRCRTKRSQRRPGPGAERSQRRRGPGAERSHL
jgi:hypothetical protein